MRGSGGGFNFIADQRSPLGKGWYVNDSRPEEEEEEEESLRSECLKRRENINSRGVGRPLELVASK